MRVSRKHGARVMRRQGRRARLAEGQRERAGALCRMRYARADPIRPDLRGRIDCTKVSVDTLVLVGARGAMTGKDSAVLPLPENYFANCSVNGALHRAPFRWGAARTAGG